MYPAKNKGKILEMIHSSWFLHHDSFRQASLHSEFRLLCFPHSGGGASIFRKWSTYLPNTFEVYPVQLPGRENRFREPLLQSMESVIEELWPQVIPLLDKPLALFGHSLGALIVFELAKKIEANRIQQKVILFVSACLPPAYIDHSFPLHTLNNEEFIVQLNSYGAMPKQLLENREALNLLLPCLRADFSIFETYSCSTHFPMQMPIIAIGGDNDALVDSNRLLDWQNYTSGLFETHLFPGGHFYYYHEAQELCKKIELFF